MIGRLELNKPWMEAGKFDDLRRINQLVMKVGPGREMLNSTLEVDNFYP